MAAADGVVVASGPDFAFPVFGVTNRYWKAGSSVRLEYAGALAPGQTVEFTVNGEPLAHDVFAMPATNVTVSANIAYNGSPAFPAYLDGADDLVKSNYVAWAATYGADTAGTHEVAFLLNVAPGAASAELRIDGIEVVAGGATIRVVATAGGEAVDMSEINGVLVVAAGDDISSHAPKAIPAANLSCAAGAATVFVPSSAGAFVQARILAAAPNAQFVPCRTSR